MARRESKRSVILSSFGKRLRALRLAKGLTPSRFYRATGINKETLRKYEGGELEPKLVAIMTIAKALEVSHLELLGTDTQGDYFK